MNNARQTGAVLEAHFQFLQWLFPAIARFPRSAPPHHCEPQQLAGSFSILFTLALVTETLLL